MSGNNSSATLIDSILNLKRNQLDSLKSLNSLLAREIEFIENFEKNISKQLNEGAINLYEELENFEKNIIRIALIKTGGSQNKAARLLGLNATTINSKIKRYKIKKIDSSLHITEK